MIRKKWKTALILSGLLGIFGADRFYLGFSTLGALKFITLGGIGVWWLLDLFLILTDRMTDANDLPLVRSFDRTISPKDTMYAPGHVDHYFSTAQSAIDAIQAGLLAAGVPSPQNILDLPCGYGRVQRMLKAYFPAAEITACDLDRDAVDFCADQFGARKFYSTEDFSQLELPGSFDLIWVGSLLTHVDLSVWRAFFEFCIAHLNNDGVFIFSTHGRYAAKMITHYDFSYGLSTGGVQGLLANYEKSGFGYVDYPDQSKYGISVCVPSWVVSFIEGYPELQIAACYEMAWSEHHDIYTCVRVKDPVQEELNSIDFKSFDWTGLASHRNKTSKDEDFQYVRDRATELISARIQEAGKPIGPRVQSILTKKLLDQWLRAVTDKNH